jgi:hypothetical protein
MRRTIGGGVQAEEEGVEATAGLNVASLALVSISPRHHQPAMKAANIVPAQNTVAHTIDDGRKDT